MQNTIEKFHDKHQYYEHIECLATHLAGYFKDEEISVFHEVVSLDFHLDVFFIQPADRNYNILLTSGMSLLEMTVPETIEDRAKYSFAELMILLPKSMDFGPMHDVPDKNAWVINMLKQAARFPHHCDTFISIGHSMQATEDLEPYETDTQFVGCVFLPSPSFDSKFTEFNCGKNVINIYSVFPIYKNELEYKIQYGFNAFLDLVIKSNPKDILDNERKNMIPTKKNFWGLFKK